MTVSQLIEELRKMPPHAPVAVYIATIIMEDEVGDHRIELDRGSGSGMVNDVTWQGNHVSVESA